MELFSISVIETPLFSTHKQNSMNHKRELAWIFDLGQAPFKSYLDRLHYFQFPRLIGRFGTDLFIEVKLLVNIIEIESYD